jgi:hypothetical protein
LIRGGGRARFEFEAQIGELLLGGLLGGFGQPGAFFEVRGDRHEALILYPEAFGYGALPGPRQISDGGH